MERCSSILETLIGKNAKILEYSFVMFYLLSKLIFARVICKQSYHIQSQKGLNNKQEQYKQRNWEDASVK